MDDIEDDARYPPKHYSVNHRLTYDSSTRLKHSNRNPSYPIESNYGDDNGEDDEYENDELGEEDEALNNEFDDRNDADEGDEEDVESGYDGSERCQKKRRVESLVSNYEFAPRKSSQGVRNSPVDWTEHATFVLLEAWGDRFLKLGRNSLRSEDWQEVAEKVSEGLKMDWTDTQCRSRLDTLKKKYKKEKEKEKMDGMGGYASKWDFFRKMDMLLNSSRQQFGLPCGVDSGEFVFMNPRVYLNRSNGLDEMRDSPDESESSDDDEDSDGLPPKRKGFGGEDHDGSSFRLLADSVQKFGEIYEKIETSKKEQMMELEKMRMDFQRELEVQKKQILERAQAAIAKIQEGDDDETDGSAENLSEIFSRKMTLELAAILKRLLLSAWWRQE
ncbi:unnamed protein product [Camellia sinensis]